MSPAKLSDKLQTGFVWNELETGHRMLELAAEQRHVQPAEVVMQTLDLARVALSGAEMHLAAISLPPDETKRLSQAARQLRGAIQSFSESRPA